MQLTNKVTVITGASDGIGKEIALRLAKENSHLALIARNEKRLNEVIEKAKTKTLEAINVRAYICDIRQTDRLKETVDAIISDFGAVDILINNAGIRQKLMQIDDIEKDVVDSVIETNLSALIHTTRLFLPTLRTRDEAAIINISSKSGVVAPEGQAVYAATKHGVRWFTEVIKKDLKYTNVRVAGVYQSSTNTKMFEKKWDTLQMGKFINPSDLADVIGYMLTRPDKLWMSDVRIERSY